MGLSQILRIQWVGSKILKTLSTCNYSLMEVGGIEPPSESA